MIDNIDIEWNEGVVLSESKRAKVVRLAGFCGLTAPVIVFTLVATSIFYSPWFSWTANALSDLGVHGFAAISFNSGLIIGGILVLMSAAAALCAIGLFPETAGEIHFYVSAAFFTLFPISLFLIGAATIGHRPVRTLGLLAVLAGLTAALVWALPWTSAAIPEALSSIALSVWSMASGAKLLEEVS